MGKIFSYSILSGFIMLAMYLAYKLFIAREKQHNFNRGILLSIYLVSFSAIPLQNFAESMLTRKIDLTINIIERDNPIVEISEEPFWGTLLIWLFIIGMLVVTIKTILTWYRIVCVIRSGYKIKKDGFTLVVIDNDKIAPFSWLRYVVINDKDFTENDTAVIAHEWKHIKSCHWLDLLIAQLVCILNWFNPAAWLMRDEIMLVHEYQADMAVIDSGHNPQEYQKLLIKKAVGARFPSLANSINHSKLKKRITMMYKSESGAGSKIKALALVPMISLALVVISSPIVKATVSTISNSDVLLDKDSENLGGKSQIKITSLTVKSTNNNNVTSERNNENQEECPQFKITSLNNSGVETTVVVRGEELGNNITVSGGNFTNKGKVYPAKSLKADMKNGDVIITSIFPFCDNYENASITFNINGKDVTLYLEEFRKNSQSPSVSVTPSKGITIHNGNASLPITGDIDIYLDGKKISEDEMNVLKSENIASVSIDTQSHRISIISK